MAHNAPDDRRTPVEAIVESSQAIFWEAEVPGINFTYVSSYAEPLLGFACDRWYRRGFWESRLHPDDREGALRFCAEQTELGNDHEFEYRFRHADGSHRWLRDIVTVIRADGRQAGAWLLRGVMIDITALKEGEVRLREAQRLAEEANAAKDRLIARVSHELRTPLNGILGATQIAGLRDTRPEDRRLFDTVDQCARVLHRLVEDLLDASHAAGGELTLNEVWFEVADLGREISDSFGPEALAKGIELVVRHDARALAERLGDGPRVGQIVGNLVRNAISHTETGRVVVTFGGDAGTLSITVSDSGSGMTPEQFAAAVEPFVRLSPAGAGADPGLGLGLPIARDLTERMGGEIQIDPDTSTGARISVVLPLGGRGGVRRARGVALCVDDNPVNATIASEMLRSFGLSVVVADSGRSALDQARARAFDVILMDIRMPGLDGIETTRLLRGIEAGARRSPAPVIALTADARAGLADECRAAGMVGFMTKPVDLDRLRLLVDEAMSA